MTGVEVVYASVEHSNEWPNTFDVTISLRVKTDTPGEALIAVIGAIEEAD